MVVGGDLGDPRGHLKQQSIDVRVGPLVSADRFHYFTSNDLVRREVNIARFVYDPLGDATIEPASDVLPGLLLLGAELRIDHIKALLDSGEQRRQIALMML